MSKTYIVAPNFSMVPNSLCLGDVIENPLSSDLVPLNRLDRIQIPAQDLYEVDEKKSFGVSRKTLLSGRFGLWAHILGFLGLPMSMNAGLFVERNSTDVINAETLETHEFAATTEYIEDVVASRRVKAFLEGSEYKAKPFMVTGLKIAKKASLNQKASRNVEVAAGPGAEVPGIKLKPGVEFIAQRTNGVSFKSSTDFILAFRVRQVEVKFDRDTNTVSVSKHVLSTQGASMAGDKIDNEKPEISSVELGEELRPSDLGLEIFGEDEQEVWVIPDLADDSDDD